MGIGEQIQSWCTRCRQMRGHVVAEIAHKRPTRVTCASCQGEHLYRAQPPRSRVQTSDGTVHVQPADWVDLMAVADLDKVQPYAMKRVYATGDVVSHRAFGLGVVVREVDGGKIQVSFKDGIRLMVCNRHR
jgi:hypothetical protein